jgi:hypothetical protein
MIIVVTLKITISTSDHVHVVSILANLQASIIVEALPLFKVNGSDLEGCNVSMKVRERNSRVLSPTRSVNGSIWCLVVSKWLINGCIPIHS